MRSSEELSVIGELRNADCGLRNPIQEPRITTMLSGDPQGSVGELRNSDFGLRIWVRRGGLGCEISGMRTCAAYVS